MRSPHHHPFLVLSFCLGALFLLDGCARTLPSTMPSPFRLLVFSHTTGYRHASIAAGVEAIRQLGTRHGFQVDATEDPAVFTEGNLASYAAVAFLNTSGDVLDPAQQAAFEAYIGSGGGFVGVHGAAATEYDWAWYGGLVGAFFDDHPAVQPAEIQVLDRAHPSTRHLPARWSRTDEWYNFRTNPRGRVHVLMTLDETTYEGGTMGHDHPIAWAHAYDGGRAWYTALGHPVEAYSEPAFLQHLLGGILWAAGAAEGDAGATATGSFEKVTLTTDTTDPMELAVAPDGRVFFVEREGAVKVWDPATDSTTTAGYVPSLAIHNEGMMGLALDPGFGDNGWLYVFHTPQGPREVNTVARYTVRRNRLNPASRTVILEVPTQRAECCHSGGSIAFGPEGLLYVATGDNTNPHESDGFAPLDERPGRQAWDAQRTSANTQDLRGKILRVRPLPEGGYAIPEGNLFADTSEGRPEIYVMGARNPYRISVDAATGTLYWGDVGPDAGAPHPARGPEGYDEINRTRTAGNYGWPYVIADDRAYHDYDFATQEPGPPFDPAHPVNASSNNTGARVLPPARPALIWYPYGPSEAFPALGSGGRVAMAGPVYHHDPATVHPRGLPAYFDDALFVYDWMRGTLFTVKLDDAGDVLALHPFLPEHPFARPHDLEVGPDGRLYLIEWGADYGGNNLDARIVRLDYYGTPERPPRAGIAASATSGPAPLRVDFEAETADTTALRYAWDFDGDGTTDARTAGAAYTYERPGTYTARLTVTNAAGLATAKTLRVTAGNTAPSVAFRWPPDGGFFDFGAPIPYRLAVSDPEDGPVDEEAVTLEAYLGLDTHTMPPVTQTGTAGTVRVPYDDVHAPYLNDVFALLRARYTDTGGPGAPPLTAEAHVTLHPKRLQAEYVSALQGAWREVVGDVRRKDPNVEAYVVAGDGDHVVYDPVNLAHIDALTFRVQPDRGGTLRLHLDAPDGPVLGTITVPAAEDDPAAWHDLRLAVQDPGGTRALYLVFEGPPKGTLMKLDWIEAHGPGVMQEGR